MADLGLGLVDDAVAELAGGEGQVRVLVVGRRVAPVEAAEGVEDLLTYEQTGARAVVHVTHEVVGRVIGVPAPAVVEPGAVPPDDASGLLQGSVRVDELGTDDSDVLLGLHRPHEGIEPTRRTSVSLFNKSTYRPLARSSPALTAPMKPEFCFIRSTVIPPTRE